MHNVGIVWAYVISVTAVKRHRCPSSRGIGELQIWSGRFGEDNILLPLLKLERFLVTAALYF
jgi:hypothetical protein